MATPEEEVKRSLLSRVGQGIVAFGAGVPSSQIDTIRSERDIRANQAQIGQQEIEANQAAIKQQQRQQELVGIISSGDPEQRTQALAQLSVEFPEQFEQTAESMGLLTQGQKNEAADFALRLRNTLFENRQPLIDQRVAKLASEGRDPQHTASLTSLSEEEQDIPLRVTELLALSPEDRVKAARGTPLQKSTPRIIERDGQKFVLTPTFDPQTGQTTLTESPFEGDVLSTLGETTVQRQAREIETAGGRRSAEETARIAAIEPASTETGQAKRRQTNINNAITVADALPIITRSLELLDSVETGGFAQASLAAKQRFGIESADEAELSNQLGKAVLTQLRATFGAAFTAQEGQLLQDIEAGFGKSTAGNRRLLERAERMMNRAIDRGLKSAIDAEDFEAAQQIKEAREFRLSPDAQQVVPETEAFDPSLLEFMTPEQRALFEQ